VFEPRSNQTQDHNIGISCFSAKHAALTRKNKDWLARNQDNVSEWSDMSTRGVLFQGTSTIKFQLSVLVQYKADTSIISSNVTYSHHDIAEKIASFGVNNHSLILSGIRPICILLTYTCTYIRCLLKGTKFNNI
jgi:hypothetical protein